MRTHRRHALPLAIATAMALAAPVALPGTAAAEPCGTGSGISGAEFSGADASTGGGSEHAPRGRKPLAPRTAPAGTYAGTAEFGTAAVGAGAATRIGWVTGKDAPTRGGKSFYSRFGISGTDLGIMWDNGDGDTLVAFGDTFGDCSKPGDEWRFNVLFRSTDDNLGDADKLSFSAPDTESGNTAAGSPVTDTRPDFSKQVIPDPGYTKQVTLIPTAAISVGDRQYINFMSVRKWGSAGRWNTNYSAIAYSDDNGETWTVDRGTVRLNSGVRASGFSYTRGNNNFQMGAFVDGHHTGGEGYVYSFGTPNGRFGAAKLSRVPAGDILTLSKYEYWNGKTWVPNKPSSAKTVFGAPVSEMSVQWSAYLGKYIAMYTDGWANVVFRTADKPEGPWTRAQAIVSSWNMPGIYAPYIHPRAATNADDNNLYFTLSLWGPYHVMLMRTTLTR